MPFIGSLWDVNYGPYKLHDMVHINLSVCIIDVRVRWTGKPSKIDSELEKIETFHSKIERRIF